MPLSLLLLRVLRHECGGIESICMIKDPLKEKGETRKFLYI